MSSLPLILSKMQCSVVLWNLPLTRSVIRLYAT